MRAPAIPLLVALAATVGCLAPGPGADPDPVDRARFSVAVAALASCRPNANTACWEPSVAALPDGTLAVTDFWGESVAVSRDGGRSFEALAGPAPPRGSPSGADRRDAILRADEEGVLYFAALVAEATPAGAPIHGIQVARSDDAGASWSTNQLLASPASPGTLAHVPDRPWIVPGPKGTVLVSYTNAARQEAWVARSDDGGATFGAFRLAIPFVEHATASPAGPPAADAGTRVLVPYFAGPPSATSATSRVRIALSEDAGDTWRSVTVTDLDAETAGASYWPVAAVDGESVRVAWTSTSGRVLVAASDDAGETWRAPSTWNLDGEPARVVPWIAQSRDRLVAAWYALEGSDLGVTFAQAPWRAERDAVPERWRVAESVNESFAPSEFAHAAVLADGRVAIVWGDGDGKVLTAMEKLAS